MSMTACFCSEVKALLRLLKRFDYGTETGNRIQCAQSRQAGKRNKCLERRERLDAIGESGRRREETQSTSTTSEGTANVMNAQIHSLADSANALGTFQSPRIRIDTRP